MVLSARGLTKRFGDTTALDLVDMDVRGGEVLAIVGPSGSGKSTLLHCLAGLVMPDDGDVLFLGQSIPALTERDRCILRRRQFGFLFQFGQLVPELSMLENVVLPLLLDGIAARRAKHHASELLERLGVGHVASRIPGEVSGGEAQRVALARAVIATPTVVFADEPTGALDSRSGELVMRLLLESTRDAGSAVVLVTHESTIASYATRVATLRDGKNVSMARQ